MLGHEFAGTVVEAPGVEGLEPGQRVVARPLVPCGECEACAAGEIQLCEAGMGDNIGYGRRGAFAERVLVPKAAVGRVVFPLPDEIDDRSAALVEPLAVALHAVNRSRVEPGQAAVVLGAGPIGLGVTAFLRRVGVGTLLVSDPSRAAARGGALALGADAAIDPLAESTVAAVVRAHRDRRLRQRRPRRPGDRLRRGSGRPRRRRPLRALRRYGRALRDVRGARPSCGRTS